MKDLVFAAIAVSFFVSALASIYFNDQMTLNRKADVPYFPGDGEKPGSIISRPEQLTEEGLRARRRYIISRNFAIVSLAAAILFAAAVG